MAVTIDYTPPPTVSRFIKDYLPGELFYNWIVGPVGCLPGDSEFLTPLGWKRMDSWTPGDEVAVWDRGEVSFEEADYVKAPATAPFHVFDSGSLRMELSPEHTVLYDDYRGVRKTCKAHEMARKPSRRTIPTTFAMARPDTAMSDAEIRLRIAISADGHVPQRGRQTIITVRKERKKIRLRELLRDAQATWTERTYEGRPTETRFAIDGWRDKSLAFVWKLSTRQLRVVVDECTRWDGLSDHAEKRFYTTRRDFADAVQFAAHGSGLRASIKEYRDPRSGEWAPQFTVHIRAGDNPKNRAMVREETRIEVREAPDGWKYCFTTSTGFFIARCNGTVFVTGNSGKTTGIFFKLIYMAGLQAPGPDGIRRSRAVIVRNTSTQLRDTTLNSWFTWFRDGQAGQWKATDKTFILRYADVECEVMFRPLDTPDDVARVLSLEVTFAIIDEFVEIPQAIVDALSARCGRYPSVVMGGATNWGMWGSSNPSTEDNWWFDHLHSGKGVVQPGEDMSLRYRPPGDARNARYFLQPSGYSAFAENVDNLPGKAGYYTNQAKNKSEAWIKQFIEAEWGFSIAGKPVVQAFNAQVHVSRTALRFDPNLMLVGGFDPGLAGGAMVLGQEDLEGRLHVLGEIITSGVGASRFINERLRPYLARRMPELRPGMFVLAPDPAANNRSANDESTIVATLRRHFPVSIESNNRLPLRLDAIDYFCTRMVYGLPSLVIDEQACPMLIRALKGGWRYALDKKENIRGIGPEKNSYSHPGDAFGYLCRYFHRQVQKNERYTAAGVKPFTPPRSFGSRYHFT